MSEERKYKESDILTEAIRAVEELIYLCAILVKNETIPVGLWYTK